MSGFSRDTFSSILGGGIPGNQPIGGGYRDTAFENTRGVTRSVLRRSFGNLYNDGLDSSPLQIATRGESNCGSFRAATMAGDVVGSVNSATNINSRIVSSRLWYCCNVSAYSWYYIPIYWDESRRLNY